MSEEKQKSGSKFSETLVTILSVILGVLIGIGAALATYGLAAVALIDLLK